MTERRIYPLGGGSGSGGGFDGYILTDEDKNEIAEIVKTECIDEVEMMIDESGVLT